MRAFFVLFCFLACGCGVATTPVSGTVDFKGTPLPSGTVAFFGEDNSVTRANIDDAGHFAIEKLPVGKYRLSVATPWIPPVTKRATPPDETPRPPPLNPAFPPTMPVAPTPKSIAIPARYNDPATSNLTVDVVREMPPFDIKLVE